MTKDKRSVMDTDAILKKHGYGGKDEYPKIAKYASTVHWDSEERLLYEVSRIFGDPQTCQHDLQGDCAPLKTFLDPEILVEKMALDQMNTALRLPVAVRGALMPDVHPGFSLPIGGVIALREAIAPAFVGFDIGCQMRLSITPGAFKKDPLASRADQNSFLKIILKNTAFGLGADTQGKLDHPVMHNPLWEMIPFLKANKDIAQQQLGSSGGGNHFCSAGTIYHKGLYSIAILSHSGSRGIGKKVGDYYAALADKITATQWRGVPKGYGWLPIGSIEGTEYWSVISLLVEYAKANHDLIHNRILTAAHIGGNVAQISSVHNTAVRQGDLIVHRKGAIDASKGKMGIIPGTCGTSSYIVTGLGNEDSLCSASHGAGRLCSSSEAKRRYVEADFLQHMRSNGITHHGIDKNETPAAYKDIHAVIRSERDLVEPLLLFKPRVVVMGGNNRSDDGD